jgi:beta-barrel assembly-enhancing protease
MRPIIGLALYLLVAPLQIQTNPTITDADEIRLGQVLADDFIAQEGMQPTPQTRKLDEYLQSIGDRVAAHAQRKIPYRFRFDPSPSFRSAVGLPGGQIFVEAGILAYMDSEDQLAMVLGLKSSILT